NITCDNTASQVQDLNRRICVSILEPVLLAPLFVFPHFPCFIILARPQTSLRSLLLPFFRCIMRLVAFIPHFFPYFYLCRCFFLSFLLVCYFPIISQFCELSIGKYILPVLVMSYRDDLKGRRLCSYPFRWLFFDGISPFILGMILNVVDSAVCG